MTSILREISYVTVIFCFVLNTLLGLSIIRRLKDPETRASDRSFGTSGSYGSKFRIRDLDIKDSGAMS